MKIPSILFNTFLLAAMTLPSLAHAQKEALSGAGSTFAAAAYTSWGLSYAKEKNTTVVYKATGSGDGIRQILAHNVDFGASDYAMSAAELKKNDLIQFPTLIGGIVPVINLPGIKAGQLKFTGPVLAGIFSGRITSWNDAEILALNPGLNLPNMLIKRIVRADDSGTTAGFSEYLSKVDANWASRFASGLRISWPKGTESANGNDGIANAVLATTGAISYVSINQAFRSKLTYVLLQNRNRQFVAPTDEALLAAAKSSVASRDDTPSFIDMAVPNAWPITDATYVLIERNPKKPERARDVLRFFYWAFLRGDAMATETGYVPLPAPVQARVVGSFRLVRDTHGNPLDFMRALLREGVMLTEAGHAHLSPPV